MNQSEINVQSTALKEANRLMTICNSCRYCEGLCAVFPAMEKRSSFFEGDLNYLANLCHDCGACYSACQFAPPHEFSVDVPTNFAKVRSESYETYVWPAFLAPMFLRNGVKISFVAAICLVFFLVGFVGWNDSSDLWSYNTGPGAFYRLMPHHMMVFIFGTAFSYAIIAGLFSARKFWRDSKDNFDNRTHVRNFWSATKDATSLRYLGGEGLICSVSENVFNDRRRLYHHFTFYGFFLCFLSTITATFYHYLLGREAPYPWYDFPVILGIAGGIGLIVGPLGLLWEKYNNRKIKKALGMDVAFLVMLFLTSLTGIMLLILRSSPAMGILLFIHLGIVFSLFITMPYGKFIHGIYRFLALVRFSQER